MIVKNQRVNTGICTRLFDQFAAPYREGFKNFKLFHEAISTPQNHTKQQPLSIGKKIILIVKGVVYCIPIITRIIFLAMKLLKEHRKEDQKPIIKQPIHTSPKVHIKFEDNKEHLCPNDVKLHILSYLNPKNLKHMARMNKEYLKLSDTAKIQWINRNKVSLSRLRLTHENLVKLLKRVGDKLEYLEGDNIDKILELLPYCPNLKHLIVSQNNLPDIGIAQLVSKDFPQLKILRLSGSQGGEGIKALAQSNHFPKLKNLSLQANDLSVDAMCAFAASPHFSQLEELDLSANNPRDFNQQLEILASSPHFPNLLSLNLSNNGISIEGMLPFANSPHFSKLQRLDLSRCFINHEVLEALANSRNFPKLQFLDLDSNNCLTIGIENPIEVVRYPSFYKGIQKFAASPHFPELEELNLCGNLLNDESLESLATSANFPQLQTLNLGGNNYSSQGIKAFAESTFFSELKKLNLGGTQMDDEGCSALANSPNFPQLRYLGLGGNGIRNTGAIDFANSPHFSKLQELHFDPNCIQDEGIRALIRSPHFPELTVLNLEDSRSIQEKALRKLINSEEPETCPKKLKTELDTIDHQKIIHTSTRSD